MASAITAADATTTIDWTLTPLPYHPMHMLAKPKILGDHKRQGKILVPPFAHKLGPIQEVSWVKMMMPELCWIGLIHQLSGHQRAVELITGLARCARQVQPSSSTHIFATVSSFSTLSHAQGEALRSAASSKGVLDEILLALKPLVSNYPQCSLRTLFAEPPADAIYVDPVKELIGSMYDRAARNTMMIQATAIWLAFDADILKIAKGLALASFPEIQNYPDTELSRRIGGSIRGTLNMMFGHEGHFGTPSDWPRYFWNQGLAIDLCEVADV